MHAAARRTINIAGSYYFFVFAGLGGIFPFLGPLLAAKGLTPREIGVAMIALPLTAVLVPPLWGVLVDALQSGVGPLRLASFGAAVAVWMVLLAQHLAASFAAIFAFGFFRAPQAPLADVVTRTALAERPHHYGRVRLWGSVGFAAAAWFVGRLGGASAPGAMLAVSSGAFLLGGLVSLGFPASAPRAGPALGRSVGAALRRGPFVMLLVASATHYVAQGMSDVFLSLHLEQRGFAPADIGLAWGTGVLAEVVVMFMGPRLLGGPSVGGASPRAPKLLLGCSLVAVVRWSLLAQLDSSAAIFATQTLHGITFGLWYLALVEQVQGTTEPAARASAQSAANASMGLGMVLGSLLGGAVAESRGTPAVFVCAAAVSGVAALLYAALGQALVAGALRPRE